VSPLLPLPFTYRGGVLRGLQLRFSISIRALSVCVCAVVHGLNLQNLPCVCAMVHGLNLQIRKVGKWIGGRDEGGRQQVQSWGRASARCGSWKPLETPLHICVCIEQRHNIPSYPILTPPTHQPNCTVQTPIYSQRWKLINRTHGITITSMH
jgi:hypothetical protein